MPKSKATASQVTPSLIRPVALVGLMGSGKSSVGQRLAKALRAAFVDADDEIKAASGLTIPEIFEQYGEGEFRALERRVMQRLMTGPPQVIATGGGAFMDPNTRHVIGEVAVSVWLRADLDVLVSRTAGRTHRPLLNAGDPREILTGLIDARYPIYAQADVAVDSPSGISHERMADKIIRALKRHGQAFAPEVA
ncbi:MAG: shikimate kinase [Pseudomonadota bacterium]